MKNMMQPVDKDNEMFKQVVAAFPNLFSDPQYAEMMNDTFFSEVDRDEEAVLYFNVKLPQGESAKNK